MTAEPATVARERGYRSVPCNQCGADDPVFRYKLVLSSIVTCRRCGLAYVTPRAGSGWLRTKLQEWARSDTVDAERLRIAFDDATMQLYSRYLGWIRRVVRITSEKPTLLDIGCSVGAFLTRAADSGYRVTGLEVGSASAAYARNQRGLDVIRGSVFEAEFPTAGFDVVSMLEVIEHLEQPKEAVRRVAGWIKPGGVLLLTTPNFDSLYRRMHGAGWWVINCEDEHIYFFTIDSLSRMIGEFGLDMAFVATRGFDIPGLVRQLLRRGERSSAAQPASGYYKARHSKEKIKAILRRMGMLRLARGALRCLDLLASRRWSPLFGCGEQIILIAVKRA